MTREQRYEKLQGLCDELNEAERQLAKAISDAHDAGWTVYMSGSKGDRKLSMNVPRGNYGD